MFPLAPTYDAPPGIPGEGVVIGVPSDRMLNLEGTLPGNLGGGPAALARLEAKSVGNLLGQHERDAGRKGGGCLFRLEAAQVKCAAIRFC